MLPPPGAIAAGGLYTATEFDVRALDPLRPSLVEMGRAVVRDGSPQRRRGAADVGGHPGLPGPLRLRLRDRLRVGARRRRGRRARPGSQIRGVRDFVLSRHAAPPEYRVHPYRPVLVDGKRPRRHRAARPAGGSAADARLPAAGRPGMRRARPRPGLRRRRFLRACWTSARRHPISASDCGRCPPAAEMAEAGGTAMSTPRRRARLAAARIVRCQLCAAPATRPAQRRSSRGAAGHASHHRWCCCWRRGCRCWRCRCRAAPASSASTAGWCCAASASESRCRAARFAICSGVLVVSGHMSWLDIFAIGAVLPGSFVAVPTCSPAARPAWWPAS